MRHSKAPRRIFMSDKTPSDFTNHHEWLSYVSEHIPAAGRSYALALGRTELFKSFYRVRNETFPSQFSKELESIDKLHDPDRTTHLDALNKRIYAALTEFLFSQVHPKVVQTDAVLVASPQERVREIRDHLKQRNPYFALWSVYKAACAGSANGEDWEAYLRGKLGPKCTNDLPFIRAMVDLDKLLTYFYDRSLPLPKFVFERSWFLHYLQEPERMLQTRSLLIILTAEIEVCMFA